MSSTAVAAADLLDKAADEIQANGWTQWNYVNRDRNLCAMGALAKAWSGNPSMFITIIASAAEQTKATWLRKLAMLNPAVAAAIVAFNEHVHDEAMPFIEKMPYDNKHEIHECVVWNDNVARNGQEVVEKLRTIALLLRAEVETTTVEARLVTA